jgi:intracellular multiplication protein IcmE
MAQTLNDNSNTKKNLKGLWTNPRNRTVLLIVGAAALAMLVVGVMNRGGQAPADTGGTRSVAAPNVQSTPGLVTDREYQEQVAAQNQRRLEEAQKSGATVLPTLQSASQAPSLDPLSNVPQTAPPAAQVVAPGPVVAPVVQAPQVAPAAAAPAAPAPTAVDVTRSARYKSVYDQLTGYAKTWVGVAGTQEFAYNGVLPEPPQASAEEASAGQASASGTAGATTEKKGAAFVRAGTIVPAVLLTSINSDTPGPVLAQITSGPLAGSRVLGRFQASEKEVVVQFNTISMPGHNRSFSVSAYAINEGLGTGLATDVNNHYWRRYGLLLAAGFVKGYGQAIRLSGTQTTVTDGGGVIVTQDLNDSKIAKVALGEAGTSVASEIEQASSIRPTVKVENKDGNGVPIGLLFMSDF